MHNPFLTPPDPIEYIAPSQDQPIQEDPNLVSGCELNGATTF